MHTPDADLLAGILDHALEAALIDHGQGGVTDFFMSLDSEDWADRVTRAANAAAVQLLLHSRHAQRYRGEPA